MEVQRCNTKGKNPPLSATTMSFESQRSPIKEYFEAFNINRVNLLLLNIV